MIQDSMKQVIRQNKVPDMPSTDVSIVPWLNGKSVNKLEYELNMTISLSLIGMSCYQRRCFRRYMH
jgi:hypothetical protein